MNRERLPNSTRLVSLGTASSKALGLLRSVLMAALFGTSSAQSAFVLAFRVPNLFRRLFGEGALAAAFIPVFAETLEQEGLPRARQLAARVAALLTATLVMIAAGGMALALLMRSRSAPDGSAELFFSLLAILLPYLVFICLVALGAAILNTFHRFFVPAFVPVLLNVVWIAALLTVCPRLGERPQERIFGVAWAIVLAGLVQLLAQLPLLFRLLRHPGRASAHRTVAARRTPALHDPQIKRIVRAMAPVAFGMGVFQVNVLLDGFLAYWVADWAPAALSFAELIVYLPLGVFATATGTVLLPTLARCVAAGTADRMGGLLQSALIRLMALVIPAAVGLALLARPVTQMIYEWPGREFDALSTAQTARALLFYAPGLVVFSLQKTLVPAFYALKDTRTPVRVGLAAVGLNLGLNLLFILTWPAAYKHAGLAFATVLASLFNGLALAVLLRRRLAVPDWRAVARGLGPILCAAAPMGGLVVMLYPCLLRLAQTPALPAKAQQTMGLLATVAVGALCYGVLLFLLRRLDRGIR
jgi:putative peptidoglycan lipid II flippase